MNAIGKKEAGQKNRKARFNPDHVIPLEYLEVAAYYHWQSRGCPLGDPLTDWLAVERQWKERMEQSRKRWWLLPNLHPYFARSF